MANTVAIRRPELLQLHAQNGHTYGANQEWYPDRWQRQAGCGPTNSSHLLWYLSRTQPGCECLVPFDASEQDGFVRLMQEVWQFVTPGRMGINKPELLAEGVRRYAQHHGLSLQSYVMHVPYHTCRNTTQQEMDEFLTGVFERDLPVAFLNLSNGKLRNLYGWHWVTLVDYNPETHMATMYDEGKRTKIDLGLWLETSQLGGGFVAVEGC